jgi:hypothetical protein
MRKLFKICHQDKYFENYKYECKFPENQVKGLAQCVKQVGNELVFPVSHIENIFF